MTYLVLDTNIIVSALWSTSIQSKPRRLLEHCLKRRYQTIYTHEIAREYADVLARDKFQFDAKSVADILDFFRFRAIAADPFFPSLSRPQCSNPADQKFYDAACCCDALLVTGNKEHYPDDARVLTPAEFFEHRTV